MLRHLTAVVCRIHDTVHSIQRAICICNATTHVINYKLLVWLKVAGGPVFCTTVFILFYFSLLKMSLFRIPLLEFSTAAVVVQFSHQYLFWAVIETMCGVVRACSIDCQCTHWSIKTCHLFGTKTPIYLGRPLQFLTYWKQERLLYNLLT